MRKYILIPILTGLLTITSCSDQLERFPIDSLVDATAFQTVADLQNGLRGAIWGLNPDNVVQFNAAFTDNARIGKDSGGQAINVLNQVLNPDTGDLGFWTDRYNVLNRINRVLANAANITPEPAEQAQYNNIVGQLLAMRGWIHSELLIYYGLDITDPNSLGVVIQAEVNTDAKGERSTTGEVLAAIEADFTEAQSLITSTDVNYPTDDFITFVRARLALWTENYSQAVSLATNLIGKYPLANAAQYQGMFAGDTDQTEVIWKFDNVQGANNTVAANFKFTASVEDNNFLAISLGFFDLLDPADVRFSVLVSPDGAGSSFADEDYGVNKYPPNADTQYINDFKIMRISEMYLLRAEANARLNNFAAARNDISALRAIRNSANATPNYATQLEAMADIELERRIELAFEGHRYLDIKRYRSIFSRGIERDPRDCGGTRPCNLAPSSEKWIFPIPTVEIIGNDEITQAPNY